LVAPSSGGSIAGTPFTFAFGYTDSKGYQSLSYAFADIARSAYSLNACLVKYYRPRNELWLQNDYGTAFLGPVAPGGAGTLSNCQCTLDAGSSSVTGSGNLLTLNLAISFTPLFLGNQGIYSYAVDHDGSTTPGRRQVGTWDVTPIP
jgi:large repetitive protein